MSIIDRLRAASASAGHWLKHTSVQLAVLVASIGAWATAYPDQAEQLKTQVFALVPEQYRPLATFLVVTALPIWARVRSQGLAPKGDGQNQ